MTATATPAPSEAPAPGEGARAPRHVSVARGYRFELVKLLAQWRIRVLIVLCLIGPALGVAVVSRGETLPADTLFGRQMNATGWAGALVVLGVAGYYLLPLLTSVVAGDVFSSEDRLGTWRHLLVAVRSPRRIFIAKSLASVTILLICVPGLAVSAIVGALASGNRVLTGLDGHQIAPGGAAALVALAWLCALATVGAFAGIGLLASVIFGRSPVGILLPAIAGLGMQLMSQVLPMPVALRLALPAYGFLSWNGLFTDPGQLGALIISVIVSLVWAAVTTALAYLVFTRRDFTSLAQDGSLKRAVIWGIAPLIALILVTAGIIAAATGATGDGITKDKLQNSLATSFGHLYRVQDTIVNHATVTEAQLRVTASCTKGDGLVPDEGPGTDWRCYVYWHLPGVNDATGQATYQLDVAANGRYIADGDGPKEVNGYFMVHAPYGLAPNPLWQFDGLVDLLGSSPKG